MMPVFPLPLLSGSNLSRQTRDLNGITLVLSLVCTFFYVQASIANLILISVEGSVNNCLYVPCTVLL